MKGERVIQDYHTEAPEACTGIRASEGKWLDMKLNNQYTEQSDVVAEVDNG